MLSDAALIWICTVGAVLFLSAVWGEMAFARHPKLPSPWSLDMERAKTSPRFIHTWLSPVMFAGIMAFTFYLLAGLPHSDELAMMLDLWAFITAAAFALLQTFTLWRLNSWAR